MLFPPKTRHLRPLLLATALAVTSPAAAQDEGRSYDPEDVSWTKLTFKASKFIFKTSADIELTSVDEQETREAMIEASQGKPTMPDGDGSMLVTTSNSFLGRHSVNQLWLDPDTGDSYQREVKETGGRTRYKAYRFTDRGVDVIRRYPATNAEKDQPVEQWSDHSVNFDPYPENLPEKFEVTEASALFYVASAAGLKKPGDTLEIPIYSREKLSLAVLRAEETTELRISYEETSDGSTRTVTGPVQALRISATARSLDGEETPVELIGLENIELFIDPEKGIPLQLTGSVDVVGKVRARLAAVELR